MLGADELLAEGSLAAAAIKIQNETKVTVITPSSH